MPGPTAVPKDMTERDLRRMQANKTKKKAA